MSRTFYLILLTACLLFAPSLLNAQQHQESYQKEFQEAIHLFDKGLFESSIPLFEAAQNQAKNSVAKETAEFYHTRALVKIDSSGVGHHVDRFVQSYPTSNRSAILLKELLVGYD